MNKSNQFEEFSPFEERDEDKPEACLVCEALCPDAVDGTLSEAERKAFDTHVGTCAHCAQELEDTQRGAAWLGLLKSKAPEPPATLLARILAETTGAIPVPAESDAEIKPANAAEMPRVSAVVEHRPVEQPSFKANAPDPLPGLLQPEGSRGLEPGVRGSLHLVRQEKQEKHEVPAAVSQQSPADWRGKVLNFPRAARSFGLEHGQGLHPRLAMTAAMAFFSIALTLHLTGVRLRDFSAEKLQPRALQRSAAEVEASAMRSFQNLRVVYQVESRVSELRQDPLWENQSDSTKAIDPAQKQGDENKTSIRGQD